MRGQAFGVWATGSKAQKQQNTYYRYYCNKGVHLGTVYTRALLIDSTAVAGISYVSGAFE